MSLETRCTQTPYKTDGSSFSSRESSVSSRRMSDSHVQGSQRPVSTGPAEKSPVGSRGGFSDSEQELLNTAVREASHEFLVKRPGFFAVQVSADRASIQRNDIGRTSQLTDRPIRTGPSHIAQDRHRGPPSHAPRVPRPLRRPLLGAGGARRAGPHPRRVLGRVPRRPPQPRRPLLVVEPRPEQLAAGGGVGRGRGLATPRVRRGPLKGV